MKQYLGDGVYLELDRGMLKLTTNQLNNPDNTIYLEPEVYNNLVMIVQHRYALDVRGISPVFVEQDPRARSSEDP